MNKQMSVHPGFLVKDAIEELGITNKEFSEKSNIPLNEVELLLNFKLDINDDLAEKLSNFFGTSKEVWLNLQTTYNLNNKKRPQVQWTHGLVIV